MSNLTYIDMMNKFSSTTLAEAVENADSIYAEG